MDEKMDEGKLFKRVVHNQLLDRIFSLSNLSIVAKVNEPVRDVMPIVGCVGWSQGEWCVADCRLFVLWFD
jgi:hypothetical protein